MECKVDLNIPYEISFSLLLLKYLVSNVFFFLYYVPVGDYVVNMMILWNYAVNQIWLFEEVSESKQSHIILTEIPIKL